MLTLSAEELRELTGRRRSDAQRRELDALRVRYGVRADGTLVVLRSAVESLYGPAMPGQVRRREPELMP